MATGWATRQVPHSGLRPVPRREWAIAEPDPTGDTPAEQRRVPLWAPNPNGKPVMDPNNPLRRMYPRKEPQEWKDPKRRIPFNQENAGDNRMQGEVTVEKNKRNFGWGVR